MVGQSKFMVKLLVILQKTIFSGSAARSQSYQTMISFFSDFRYYAWPFPSTGNIFSCHKHSSLTMKNRKNLRFMKKNVW
jgi:hypothetical protein